MQLKISACRCTETACQCTAESNVTASNEPKLKGYKYTPLKSPNALRLIKLHPARDIQEDIDCEIIEVPENAYIRGETSLDTSQDQTQDSNRSNNANTMTTVEDDGTNDNDSETSDVGDGYLSYEAVSWYWGREPDDQVLRVHDKGRVRAFEISRNLKTALWALRKSNVVRYLWIDAICINQKDTQERNEQVPRMDSIYGMADSVCIWLGDADEDSNLAMRFISKVLELWDFDKLIENKEMARHWAAFITLMKRPWFSRRWVVQEIALSPRGGTIYCGKEHASWQDFADAVSLFVEVESATHRLSEVMILDDELGNIPDFFGDVSSLGAALLVDATSNLFRKEGSTTGKLKTIGERKPLSSLEYLVSRLPVFEATQPRDTIYALLAISKDTSPKNMSDLARSKTENHAMAIAPARGKGFLMQSYNVDYKLPVIDVYKEFIEFSIRKSRPDRALDILCRPWAPRVLKSHDDPNFLSPRSKKNREKQTSKDDEEIPLPTWIPGLSSAAFQMVEHPTLGLRMERQNADPLVGLPDQSGHRNYSAAGGKELDLKKLDFRKWKTLQEPKAHYPPYSMFVSGFILDTVMTVEHLAQNGNIPYQWLWAGGWTDTDQYPDESFWRTLVADRGHGGRNPPTYFPRACKESMKFKAKTMSRTGGNLDTKKLINEGRCTIVAEFLRRMQEVIWNRQLMRTTKHRLGLVRDDVSPGFKVCILYGCSVPVILQEIPKSPSDIEKERTEEYEAWRRKLPAVVSKVQRIYREIRDRKKEIREKRAKFKGKGLEQSTKVEASEANVNVSDSALLNDKDIMGPSDDAKEDDTNTTAELSTKDEASEVNVEVSDNALIDDEDIAGSRDDTKDEDTNTAKISRTEEHTEWKKAFEKSKARENIKIPRSYYRFLGECYVHGMMNGEAIGLQNQAIIDKDYTLKETVFELR
ncbi:HET-domain-containing protein [Acephala macrosclerotiorum]|nr:HET-domain-containing protein [Acephala macrosclerotiorum]